MNGCGRPDLEFEPAPFFFYRCSVRKYKSPGHVTVPVPHIPFATRSGAMQSPDGRTFPFIDSYGPRAAALSLRPASGPSAVSLAANAGRTTAGRFLAPVGCFSIWPELSWSVSAWVGPAGSGRQKNRTGPTVPARWFAMPCVGKAGLRSESQNVQKPREALGLPGASAGRPYGTEPLLRGDGRPALSVSLF